LHRFAPLVLGHPFSMKLAENLQTICLKFSESSRVVFRSTCIS
jgi:hypothetical protein